MLDSWWTTAVGSIQYTRKFSTLIRTLSMLALNSIKVFPMARLGEEGMILQERAFSSVDCSTCCLLDKPCLNSPLTKSQIFPRAFVSKISERRAFTASTVKL